jgi:hypothetical protein
MTDTEPMVSSGHPYPPPATDRRSGREALADVIQQFRAAGVAIHWPPIVTLCQAVEALPHG